MRKPLLLALFAFCGACARLATPGTVVSAADNPIVTVDAGAISGLYGSWPAMYVVDRATRTCWFLAGTAAAPLNCCVARRVPAVAAFITWQDDASCARAQ